MAKMYVMLESAWLVVDGHQDFYKVGMLVSEDDHVYRQFPGLFKPVESAIRPDVEQATQAPGERRAVKLS